jgi:hypothetical protein
MQFYMRIVPITIRHCDYPGFGTILVRRVIHQVACISSLAAARAPRRYRCGANVPANLSAPN